MDRNQSFCIFLSLRLPSLSARRAWIEIPAWPGDGSLPAVSLSARRAWIEIGRNQHTEKRRESLSARRAWIEITLGGVKIGSNMSLSARRAWIEITRVALK